ncbi:restriction endonuclease S subunit [[Clostridium] cellulosi]|uniref:Restriction endonuclease S subunit n=1 Tax=[Clostridium] cellulosi TaxID=29343 RepID=A0A078KTX5_9FIRM|nr:restriction endonuclease S subunit [[Clostridium] cellulosi]
MTEWRECKLGDVCSIKGGKRLPKGSLLKKEPNSHPYIRVKDMGRKWIKIDSEYKYVPDEVFPYIKNYTVHTHDIVLSIVGTIGLVGIVDSSLNNANLSENCVKLICRHQECDNTFLYYYLISDIGQAEIDKGIVGSTQPKLPIYNINNINIPLLPLPEQKAIAEVLSSLDDKIDLLTRQNKTLEDLAQAYFRKWFIEDASDEWEVGKLGDEFNITMGQSPKGETYNDLKIGLPFFQGKAEFGFRFPLEKHYCSKPIKIADKFDTLLSVRAPVGALNMALYKCCIGRGLAIPIHKKGYKHYTFYKMKSLQELFNTFDDDGTVFGSISREKFLSIDNVIPPEKLVCYFDNFAKYFDLKIYENTVQIRTLSKLRDTLLPKLISGEIRVKI